MIRKKIITLDRKTGEKIKEEWGEVVDMTQEQYYAPIVDLYTPWLEAEMERLRTQQEREWGEEG